MYRKSIRPISRKKLNYENLLFFVITQIRYLLKIAQLKVLTAIT